MNKTLIALIAALAFASTSTNATAQSVSVEAPRQLPIPIEVDPPKPVIRELPPGPRHSEGLPDPMVIEYKLLSHLESLARKSAQIDRLTKECNVAGNYFEEADMLDRVADSLPASAVAISKRSYREGSQVKTGGCSNVTDRLNELLGHVARHEQVIHTQFALLEMIEAEKLEAGK